MKFSLVNIRLTIDCLKCGRFEVDVDEGDIWDLAQEVDGSCHVTHVYALVNCPTCNNKESVYLINNPG